MLFLEGGILSALYKNILRAYVLYHCEMMLDETGEPQMLMPHLTARTRLLNTVRSWASSVLLGTQKP
jgi:hypothetical protein